MEQILPSIPHSDITDLDVALGAWLLPRLQIYKAESCYCPSDLSSETWDMVLDKMIRAAYLLTNPDAVPLEERHGDITTGMAFLAAYVTHLWY